MATIKVDKDLFQQAQADFHYVGTILRMADILPNKGEETERLAKLFAPKKKQNWFSSLFKRKPKKMTVEQVNKCLKKLMDKKVVITGYQLAHLYAMYNPKTSISENSLRTGFTAFTSSGAIYDSLAIRIAEERGLEKIPVISYDDRLQALRNLIGYKKKSLINILSPSKKDRTMAIKTLFEGKPMKNRTFIDAMYYFATHEGWL